MGSTGLAMYHVCELPGAKLVNISNQHKCIVRHRFKKDGEQRDLNEGPQGCLIIENHSDGSEVWFDSFIVVPRDVIDRPAPRIYSDTYISAISSIKTTYKKQGARLVKELFQKLCAEGSHSHVFSQTNLQECLSGIRKLVENATATGMDAAQLAYKTKALLDSFEKEPATLWNPLELYRGLAKEKFKENWAILQTWRDWDEQRFSFLQRARAYQEMFPEDTGGTDAFRKRLQYLHLPTKYRAPQDQSVSG